MQCIIWNYCKIMLMNNEWVSCTALLFGFVNKNIETPNVHQYSLTKLGHVQHFTNELDLVLWLVDLSLYVARVHVQAHLLFPPRGETSVLWFFGESARSLQLSGYPRLCWNSQLPGPDASCWALLPETFLRGGSAWGVHAPQPDRSWEADKVWWDSGGTLKCHKFKWRCSNWLNCASCSNEKHCMFVLKLFLHPNCNNTSAPEYVFTSFC